MSFFEKIFNYFSRKYRNWSGNIVNNYAQILYPKSDIEVKDIITRAKNENKIIRVIGSKHSASPVVINRKETNIILISLEKYHRHDRDIDIDHVNMTVTVNAGWKLGQLYDELIKYNYFLETQPASSAFSIGGVCCTPVHGSRLGASLMSDSILKLTFIDQSGLEITKKYLDSDFDLYRLSAGMFGVITTVTFRIIYVAGIKAQTTTLYNILNLDTDNKNKLDRSVLDPIFKSVIKKCIDPINVEYFQCFIDVHNNAMLKIEWSDNARNNQSDYWPEITDIYTFKSPETFFGSMYKDFRSNIGLLKTIGKLIRHSIMHNIEKNMSEDQDMLWVDTAVRCYFMSYFIPVYDETNGIQLDNIYEAIEYVVGMMTEYQKHKFNFNLDLPIDIRFVTSSNLSKLSPIYSKNKRIYMSIEILVSAYNIETDENYVDDSNALINENYRTFFGIVEDKWRDLGGIPHWGKVFGFSKLHNRYPFGFEYVSTLIDDKLKVELSSKLQPLFINQFVKDMTSLCSFSWN